MAGIQVSGIGSGLDVNGIVTQLVNAERGPATSRLDRREGQLQTDLSGLGSFKSALSDFQSALSALKDASAFRPITSTVGNPDLFSASVGNDAAIGSHSISVEALAKSQTLASSATFAKTSDVVGTGTINLRFGSYDAGGLFTVNPDRTSKSITIDSSNQTLSGVRDAINKANAGVRASIVNDGTGNRLMLSSTQTGAKNAIEISVTNDGDADDANNGGLSALTYNSTTKYMQEKQAAQDAKVIIDGLTVTGATNSIAGALEGVTLDLKKAVPGEATSLNVSRNSGAATGLINKFVSAYNKLAETSKSLTSYDPKTKQSGPLNGDAGVRGIMGQVRALINSEIKGASGTFDSLADIGIKTLSSGSIQLDSSKFTKALEQDADGVAGLFARNGRTSDPLVKFAEAKDTAVSGVYSVYVNQLALQATYQNAVNTSLTVDATNNSFALKINGTQSGTISLTQKTYASGSDLAAELQSRINSDSTLSSAGVSLSVSYTSSKFLFTSNAYGSQSSLEFTSVSAQTFATLGFDVGTGTAGRDVSGKLGGVDATGSGQRLTGATGTGTSGLSVDVLGGAEASTRGTVSFSGGLVARLESMLTGYTKSGGVIDTRISGLNKQIEGIGEERTRLNTRMEKLEKQLQKQFSSLDSLVSRYQSTAAYLTQQFSGGSR